MNKFEEIASQYSMDIQVFDFLIDICIAVILSAILSVVYRKYAKSLSNKHSFSNNFMVLSATTMLIITIVKSSLALSLGLVGALSIIRFRTAIKEPEELTYLFLCIAVGLGLGANQRLVTIVGFLVITGIIVFVATKSGNKSQEQFNMHLVITSDNSDKDDIVKDVITLLKSSCYAVSLVRSDQADDLIEIAFHVGLDDFESFEAVRTTLGKLPSIKKISFIENLGIG
jgi:hypothetical protein